MCCVDEKLGREMLYGGMSKAHKEFRNSSSLTSVVENPSGRDFSLIHFTEIKNNFYMGSGNDLFA
jgi:hypothetical protein